MRSKNVVFAALVLAIALAGCGRGKTMEPVVIGPAGGTVVGPDSVALDIPKGALEKDVALSIAVIDEEKEASLGIDRQCGKAYLINPASTPLKKPISVVVPEPKKCEDAALMVGQPGRGRWSAFESKVTGKRRKGSIPMLGVLSVGTLRFVPGRDTTVFVGATFEPRVRDVRDSLVDDASISIMTTDPSRLAPDIEVAGGKLRAKATGFVSLKVSVPVITKTKALKVTIISNPAAKITLLHGNGQQAAAGFTLPDSIQVQVSDNAGRPVNGAYVDFFVKTERGNSTVDGRATDKNGRTAILWRMPMQAGTYTLNAVVAGTTVGTAVTGTATAEPKQ